MYIRVLPHSEHQDQMVLPKTDQGRPSSPTPYGDCKECIKMQSGFGC